MGAKLKTHATIYNSSKENQILMCKTCTGYVLCSVLINAQENKQRRPNENKETAEYGGSHL
jgi:hypothetical protein